MSSTLSGLGLELATATPGSPTPPTYIRGKKMLDHIWVCPQLHASVTGYGYLPFYSVLNSDHRGVFVHVKMRHHKYSKAIRTDSRKLSSQNHVSVVRYLDSLRLPIENHKL